MKEDKTRSKGKKSLKRGLAQSSETLNPRKLRRLKLHTDWSWLHSAEEFEGPVISRPMLLDETTCSYLGEIEALNRSMSSLRLADSPGASDRTSPYNALKRVQRSLSQLKPDIKRADLLNCRTNEISSRPNRDSLLKKTKKMDGIATREPVQKDENSEARFANGISSALLTPHSVSAIHRIDKVRLKKLRKDLLLR